MRIVKIFTFSAAHRLPGHEQCKNLHGHTYKLEVEIEGEQDSSGMVVDFIKFKDFVNKLIINKIDHSTIVCDKDTELLGKLQELNTKRYILPFNSTCENLVQYFLNILRQENKLTHELGAIRITRLRLYESETSYSEVNEE